MVNSRQIFNECVCTLEQAGIENAAFDADVLFTHTTGARRLFIPELDDGTAAAFLAACKQRAQHVPLQYLTGSWPFLDLELAVGPGVLVPRPETETLCRTAARLLADIPCPAVLDLCAGTGAIGLGIQSLVPNVAVTFVENAPEAFRYLQRNIASCHMMGLLCENSTFVALVEDVLAPDTPEKAAPAPVDLIAANPPYVTEEEYKTLAPELYFEPKEALVAGENGLLFYRVIAQNYRRRLKQGGQIAFEIGAGQADAVCAILRASGYANISTIRDIYDNHRVITAVNFATDQG